MSAWQKWIHVAAVACCGWMAFGQSALAVTTATGTNYPGTTFGSAGYTGTLTLDSGFPTGSTEGLIVERVEVWAFGSPYMGTPQSGKMLMRWNPYRGGVKAPEVAINLPGDGNYHLAVIGYVLARGQQTDGGGPPLNLSCRAKNNNLNDYTSNTAEYCAYDMLVFDNMAGSLRCGGGKCVTSSASAGEIVPETGWWWSPSEAGRWILIEDNAGWLFMSMEAFDGNGVPVWYMSTGPVSAEGAYSSTLFQYSGGQTLTGPYVLPKVNNNVGSVSLQFSGSGNGVLTLPGGRQVPIERFRF
jgi:hypothetical protein